MVDKDEDGTSKEGDSKPIKQEDIDKLKSVYDKALAAKDKERDDATAEASKLREELALLSKDVPTDKAEAIARERKFVEREAKLTVVASELDKERLKVAAKGIAAQTLLEYGVKVDPDELAKKGSVAEMESTALRAVLDGKKDEKKPETKKAAPKKEVESETAPRYVSTDMSSGLRDLLRESLPNFKG